MSANYLADGYIANNYMTYDPFYDAITKLGVSQVLISSYEYTTFKVMLHKGDFVELKNNSFGTTQDIIMTALDENKESIQSIISNDKDTVVDIDDNEMAKNVSYLGTGESYKIVSSGYEGYVYFVVAMNEELIEPFTVEFELINNGAIDTTKAINKKVNFIVESKPLSELSYKKLLYDKVGGDYENDINIIFGESLSLAEKVNGIFTRREIAGQVKDEALIGISKNEVFIREVARNVIDNLDFALTAMDGTEITSNFVFDEVNNKYVLDYDTSLLDGTDYTIEIKLG